MKYLPFLIIATITLTGCGKISPLSPQLDQRLNNTEGKIEDIRNNQNGLMLEIGKLRQQQDITARDIANNQQGLLNLRGTDNNGVQIFSGDGGLLAFIAIAAFVGMLIYHYRLRALKSEKTAQIFAQQIALHEDAELDDKVFMSALNTNVESDVYHLMVKNQTLTGKR